ncbi:HEAT repeat domain-containing protein [Streptacidiphilus rugosus]|uniref:HEAT repeat domain-containing protein n=1 Tax=Streptacidiphilus rugosus TaxID=405783 RepID=UPI00056B768A|nr:HEAT repeat domain-containing protein [Streptacidiphilus rugosus]
MAVAAQDADRRLVVAVATGDVDAVRACLNEGADPNAPGPDGLPVLCAAVAGFDHETAEALTEGGADPDRVLPDGTTPLLHAVDRGSPALVRAVLGEDPRLRIAEVERRRLLDLARHWHETGASEELRRRTGAVGPATRRAIEEQYTDIEEVSLGGLTVRAGHSGVLSALEQAFGVLPPVAELLARAAVHPDETHANWSAAAWALAHRRGPEDWSALADLRHDPAPVHRRLLADVLRTRNFLASLDDSLDAGPDFELLAAWALDEPNGEVLARVLDACTAGEYSGWEAVGLRYVDHPDPRVRREVPYCLSRYQTPRTEAGTAALLVLARDPAAEVRRVVADVFAAPGRELGSGPRETLLALLQDSDPGVRAAAAASLAGSADRTPVTVEALAALLDEHDQGLRLEAAFGLAWRDDPRTDQAYARVGPLGPGFDHDHRISAYFHYQRRNRPNQD